MIDISLSTAAFYTYNYKEIIEIISQTKCKQIELCLNSAFIDVTFSEVIKEIERKNLIVRSIHAPFESLFKSNEDERFWINKSINLAKLLDAKMITTHVTYKKENNNKINLDEQHKRNLVEFSNNDIIVCAENMPKSPDDSFLCHPFELFKFISEFGIALTYDTSHWADSGKTITEGYNLFKNHIRNIHLSDYLNGAEHKILGTGNLPITEFIQILNKDGYQYPLTIELDMEDRNRNIVENKTQAIEAFNNSLQLIYDSLNF